MRCPWIGLSFICICLASVAAQAQSGFTSGTYSVFGGLNQSNFGPPLPAVNANTDAVAIGIAGTSRPFATGAFLPLSDFASSQDLLTTNQNVTSLQSGLALTNQNVQALTQADQMLNSAILQNTQAIASLNQQVRHAESHASQGIAAVSSLTVVPPNPGDRFSVTFGGGDYGSEGGGGISFAYRPPEMQNMTVFAGYAHTMDANLFKGGVSFSFH